MELYMCYSFRYRYSIARILIRPYFWSLTNYSFDNVCHDMVCVTIVLFHGALEGVRCWILCTEIWCVSFISSLNYITVSSILLYRTIAIHICIHRYIPHAYYTIAISSLELSVCVYNCNVGDVHKMCTFYILSILVLIIIWHGCAVVVTM